MTNKFEKYIDRLEIKRKIKLLACELNQQYHGKHAIVIGVLKGSICFLADLIRELDFSFSVEFVRAQSYGMHGKKPKDIKLFDFDFDVSDQNLILIDDIFDRGITLDKISQSLIKARPKSLRTVVLLKKKKTHDSKIKPDHFLFEIDDRFVVGYGLDYKEEYRNLADICFID